VGIYEHDHTQGPACAIAAGAGTLSTQGVGETLDQDCPSLAPGVIIPQGIDALQKTHGYINVGTSHEPHAWTCDSLRQWWPAPGQADSPPARSRLLWGDGGGSHGARPSLFTAALARCAQETGVEGRVAHEPADASTDNSLEPRRFPHGPRACQGVRVTRVDGVKDLREKATTTTGLHVRVHLLKNV
jgi:hypothetical protein